MSTHLNWRLNSTNSGGVQSLLELQPRTNRIIKAPSAKPFPIHWGFPPRAKRQYGFALPDGYGDGSKSMLEWIKRNQAKDASSD